MLRKSHGSSPEHTEIEGTGGGRMEYITDTLNIPYHAETTILGITFASTIEHSINKRWANVIGKVRAQAMDTYERDLGLSQRIRYVQAYLLAKIWHTAQVFPAPMTCTRQFTTAIAWCVWKGATFRVPISTLQKPKRPGGWGLIGIEAKCRVLLIGRMWTQNMKKELCNSEMVPGVEPVWSRANPLT